MRTSTVRTRMRLSKQFTRAWRQRSNTMYNPRRERGESGRAIKKRRLPKHMSNRISLLLLVGALVVQTGLYAQGRGGGRGGPPMAPKAAAPIDLTGYWVSVVTEDWRYRMVTP